MVLFDDSQEQFANLCFNWHRTARVAVDQYEMKKRFQGDLLFIFFVDNLPYFPTGRAERYQAGEYSNRLSLENRDPKTNIHVDNDEAQILLGEQFDQSNMLGELPSRFLEQLQIATVVYVLECIGVERADFESCFVDHEQIVANLNSPRNGRQFNNAANPFVTNGQQ